LNKLAIYNGSKIRTKPFPKHPIIGEEEKNEIMDVLNSGNISTFIASPEKIFWEVKKSKNLKKNFQTK